MLVMDAAGTCTPCKSAPALASRPPLAERDVGDGVVLQMRATPACCVEDFDSPSFLRVPLPPPFGHTLVMAPVWWSCVSGDRAKPLTVEKLDDMLRRIGSVTQERAQSVLLCPANAADAEEADVLSVSDDVSDADVLSDASAESEIDEVGGEEEEEEGEEDALLEV